MNHTPKRYRVNLALIATFSALLLLPIDSIVVAQTLSGMAGSQDQRENAVNIDWAYNWGIEPNHDVTKANYEHVPMIWSGSPGGVQGQINRVLNLESNYGIEVDYVLGFNEPELPTQANMSVQRAIDTWDVMTNAFESTDIKMVSPAVSGNGGIQNWLNPFMTEVENRNADADPNNDLQVDAIAYHFYTVAYNPQTEANKLLGHIDQLWADYGLPIWLTEFAGTSFSLDNPVHSVEERTAFNAEFLEILIPEFEARPYLERYAWWQFGALGQPYSRLSTASNGVRTPTELGEIYSQTTLKPGESYDFVAGTTKPTDVHYLKGGSLTNSGPALDVALRAIDALEGNSSIGGSGDWGFEDAEDAFVRVRSGATLQKLGSNTITFQGIPVSNDGTLRVSAGTLSLENGIQVTGTGVLQVDTGGTLSLGVASDTTASRVEQELVLNGGTILSNPIANGENIIAETVTVESLSTFAGDGDITITGTLVAPPSGGGGIVKTGTSTMTVNGNNTYTGGTSIQGGRLLVASLVGSATGSGAVQVASGGTFGGVASVSGEVVVLDGGKLAPGMSLFNLDTEILNLGGNYTQQNLATLEIELGGTENQGLGNADYDQLLVSGDVQLDGILDLSIVEGYIPSVGDTFDIIIANSVSGMFDTINMPSGMNFVVSYLGSVVQVEVLADMPGDFDGDGDVDGGDFLVLQRGLGTTYDATDLADWQSNYNNGGSLAAVGVPEPGMFTLMVIAIAISSQKRSPRSCLTSRGN